MSARLISIIGPVAVGKTTLAEILRNSLPARLLREDYKGNPFLAKSFRGAENLSLASQLYFLFMRVKQLSAETFPADGLVVSDYGYCQDRLYAKIKLNENDWKIYKKIRRQVDDLVTPPSVVIHLDASVETLLGRIAERGRDFETAYDADYLQQLRRLHFDVVPSCDCTKIQIDCDEVDFLATEQQKNVIQKIREALT